MRTKILHPQCENKQHRCDRDSTEGWNLPVFNESVRNHLHWVARTGNIETNEVLIKRGGPDLSSMDQAVTIVLGLDTSTLGSRVWQHCVLKSLKH